MIAPTATERFAALDVKVGLDDYNFEHFRAKHLVEDIQATLATHGILPGESAPDFELPRVNGGSLRLSDLRDKPTVLHFGSVT